MDRRAHLGTSTSPALTGGSGRAAKSVGRWHVSIRSADIFAAQVRLGLVGEHRRHATSPSRQAGDGDASTSPPLSPRRAEWLDARLSAARARSHAGSAAHTAWTGSPSLRWAAARWTSIRNSAAGLPNLLAAPAPISHDLIHSGWKRR